MSTLVVSHTVETRRRRRFRYAAAALIAAVTVAAPSPLHIRFWTDPIGDDHTPTATRHYVDEGDVNGDGRDEYRLAHN